MITGAPPAGSNGNGFSATYRGANLTGATNRFRFGRIQQREARAHRRKVRSDVPVVSVEQRRLAFIKARTSLLPAEVAFKNGIWRGMIGEEVTVHNVRRVVCAVIMAMQEEAFLKAHGYKTFRDVQQAGILVLAGGDSLNSRFALATAQELVDKEVCLHRTDVCPTRELPQLVQALNAAGAILLARREEKVSMAEMHVHPAGGIDHADDFFAAVERHAHDLMQSSFHPANTHQFALGRFTNFFHPSDVLSSEAG